MVVQTNDKSGTMMQNNNIAQGYKNSPIGIIPEEWEVKRLGEFLIEGRLGGNYENSESNAGKPVIKMGNIQRGYISIDKIQCLPQDEGYNSEDILVQGDLLFNTRNTLDLVGKVSIWNNELPFALYNSNLMKMKFDKKNVSSNNFMNYVFNSHYILSQLRGIATGTTSVAAIYGRDLEKIKFIIPPLSEQQKIAKIMTVWDNAIDVETRLIASLQTRKRGLMQQLLTGKKRLKGFCGEWKEVKLGEIFNISAGGDIDKDSFSLIQDKLHPYPIYANSLINEGLYGYSSDYRIEEESITISGRGDVGQVFYRKGKYTPIVRLLTAIPKVAMSVKFMSYAASTIRFFRETTGVPQLTVPQVLFYLTPFPSIEEQTTIANILSAADKEIDLAKKKLTSLKEQKKGLMQQLLTGKKRVETPNLGVSTGFRGSNENHHTLKKPKNMTTEKFQNKYRIPSARAQWWDYGQNGAYFVTICTAHRECYFGDVVNGEMLLSEIGKIANNHWLEISTHFPFVTLTEYVIMPNHVHGIIVIDKNDDESTPLVVETPNLGVSTITPKKQGGTNDKWYAGTLGVIINQFKRICT
ncbi:MAG: restriction endonuclease subunit S, partial [Dysgonamonadaceae bacterium]|nr:restriction endonuclease subunit S [Dysgonamonadaceae bacterium]